MQTIKLTPQQPNLKGLINDTFVLVLCDTSSIGFTVSIPIGKSPISRELKFKNIGPNNLIANFDYNSQLSTSSGSIAEKTITSDECFNIANDPITGLWHQTN